MMDIQSMALLVGATALAVLAVVIVVRYRQAPRWTYKVVGGLSLLLASLAAGRLSRRRPPPNNPDNPHRDCGSAGIREVGKVAQDIITDRHSEAQDAIETAATDPAIGPSLADLLNADAAKRKRGQKE